MHKRRKMHKMTKLKKRKNGEKDKPLDDQKLIEVEKFLFTLFLC